MDKLKSFLSSFKVTKVDSLEDMLMLPKDKKAVPNSIFKYSWSYDYNSENPDSLEKAEDEIISYLKDKIANLNVPKSLVGINILHDFAYNADQLFSKGFKGTLMWTAYIYPMYSPYILSNTDFIIKNAQKLTYRCLAKSLDSEKLFVDPMPSINRRIGKTTLIVNQASKLAEDSADRLVVIVSPTNARAKLICKRNYPNLSSRVKILSRSQLESNDWQFDNIVNIGNNYYSSLIVFFDDFNADGIDYDICRINDICKLVDRDVHFSGYTYICHQDLIKKFNPHLANE